MTIFQEPDAHLAMVGHFGVLCTCGNLMLRTGEEVGKGYEAWECAPCQKTWLVEVPTVNASLLRPVRW